MASWSAYITRYGVMIPVLSAGSNQAGVSATCTPKVIWPGVLAPAGCAAPERPMAARASTSRLDSTKSSARRPEDAVIVLSLKAFSSGIRVSNVAIENKKAGLSARPAGRSYRRRQTPTRGPLFLPRPRSLARIARDLPASGEPPGAMSGVSRSPSHSQHTVLVCSCQLDREIGEGTSLARQEPAGLLLLFGEHGDGTAAVRDLSGDHAHLARAAAAASTAERDARP